ncbi:hypothetical protein IWX49DRAFT_316391 [Phyllosticta citricarpa]|uniref:Uncharacterized protein n=2 Tax=Phyllosticta TaxID=121621 RepID=A0ABR1LE59_9PEZI
MSEPCWTELNAFDCVLLCYLNGLHMLGLAQLLNVLKMTKVCILKSVFARLTRLSTIFRSSQHFLSRSTTQIFLVNNCSVIIVIGVIQCASIIKLELATLSDPFPNAAQ